MHKHNRPALNAVNRANILLSVVLDVCLLPMAYTCKVWRSCRMLEGLGGSRGIRVGGRQWRPSRTLKLEYGSVNFQAVNNLRMWLILQENAVYVSNSRQGYLVN